MNEAPEGTFMESEGWSWSELSYSCVIETSTGERRRVEVRWFGR